MEPHLLEYAYSSIEMCQLDCPRWNTGGMGDPVDGGDLVSRIAKFYRPSRAVYQEAIRALVDGLCR